MPCHPFNRKPIGPNCQNEIKARVLFTRKQIWFVPFIIVFLQIHPFVSFFEKYVFCFSPYVLLRNVFVFWFHFQHNVASGSDTQSNWKECSKSAVLSFVPCKRYKMFWKTKDCLIDWFVSSFKFCFLNKFILHFLHQFGSKLLCKLVLFSQIWGLILCKENFRARNCRDLQLCFTFLRIRFWFLKLSVFFSKQVVNRPFFLERYHKTDLWVGSSH